ncbi:MAG: uracil phosphoribosyltransferase [Bacteroidota bacterium]|jgi:uracil phosphoribosyltransferase|nr:uracil phosphoribosyltransferase [Bacteroidales bacterium]MDI9534928.1 uracil phosphoribosyltransferase [Bacteroidota bacterium]OQC46187.1 MAG: Uracil phosphoribosyltransferase [Bacteroidetes bacterium ADurb.Bin028]NLP20252.1 uracil phosphoribosyltransferase [Bacteroidales bacterium]HNY43718.1 uracil phosphoribosyltransferase [Bacteroidales bacterium]
MKLNILGGRGSLLDQFVAEIRDTQIQQDRMRFRTNLMRVGEIMAYEISKNLEFIDEEVTTSLGIATVPTLKQQPVISTILRAGLPFHQGFVNYFDHADNAFIAGYRKYNKNGTFEIKIDYITAPSIEDRIVIINDPMLASGGSIELAYKGLLNFGKPKHVHVATVIASKDGLDYVDKILPNNMITVWTIAVDDELTVKSYIVPGLGDAGDLAFGPKINY